MQKLITPRKLANFLTIVYGISLVPLLWIGRYNYPGADDFTNGSKCRQIWMETHSLALVLKGAFTKAIEEWITWRGCFTSSFLSALPPNVFGERWYVITSWLVLGMLSVSNFYFLHKVFVKLLKADKYLSRCISALMSLVMVHCMVGRVEVFYWYSGAINYLFTHGIVLIFLGLLISSCFYNGTRKTIILAAASLLGFLSGGGNQVTILYTAIILFVAAGIMVYCKKWKRHKLLAIPVAFFWIGFFLNVASPGNLVRADGASGMNPVKAVLVSLHYGLRLAVDEWTTWPVIVMVLLMIAIFWHMAGETAFQFPFPVPVVLFGYGLYSSAATPPLFALGNIEAGRLQGTLFVMYITVLTLCVGYVTGWIRKKLDRSTAVNEKAGFSVNTCRYIIVCILFAGFAAAITVIPDAHYFTFSSALTDLGNGSARVYGQALEERTELYRSGEKNIVVEPLPAQPALLYFSDIKTDAEDWENKGVCRFYGLESVRVASYDE